MKNVKKFFLLSCAIYCTACSGNGNTGNSDGQDIPKVDDSQLAYHNPVIRIADLIRLPCEQKMVIFIYMRLKISVTCRFFDQEIW